MAGGNVVNPLKAATLVPVPIDWWPPQVHRMLTAVGKQGRVAAFIVAAIVTGIIVYWGAKHPSWLTYDDAFITYRYADNLRQGLGLLYNPDEWVLGTTTPLYALILAGLGFFIPDLQSLGHWLAVVSWVAASWAAIALLWQEGWPRAGLAAGLLLAFQPYFLLSLGMETALVVALMLWTAWAWLGGRKPLAVVLAAAMILARHDSALWLLLLGLEIWRREKVLPWREALSVSALVLPWFLYAFWRYGSFLPNSAAAKFGQNELMPVGGQLPFWRELWRAATIQLNTVITALFVALLALGLGVIASRARQLWWLVGWIILYVVSYLWFGVATFPWYFVPPLAAANLIIALGIGFLLGDTRSGDLKVEAEETTGWTRLSSPGFNRLLQVVGILGLALLLAGQAAHLRSLISLPERPLAYISAGQWLESNTAEEAKVATIEIGRIGYYSQRPIVDTMGLVSLDMTEHQVGWVETLVYALNAYQPEYALALSGTAWDALVDQWWFRNTYQEVASFEQVTIYERQKADKELVRVEAAVDFVDGLALTGATFTSQELSPGEDLVAWLDVSVHQAQPPELSIQSRLIDAQTFEHVAGAESEPFGGWYGSDRWQPDDQLRIPIRFQVPADLADGAYRLGVTIVDPARDGGLPLAVAPDVLNPDIHIGWLRLGEPETPVPANDLVETHPQVHWQNGIELAGLALPDGSFTAGESLPVRLTWRPSKEIERDLTVFVHLVDDSGQIVAQQDQRPLKGRWPTPAWQPGQNYVDLYEITLPDTLPAGEYAIRLGLYDAVGRVPLSTGADDMWLWDRAVKIE